MDNDPRFIPDPAPKPKATYCEWCGKFEPGKGLIDYYTNEKFRRNFDVTIQECVFHDE